MLNNNLQILSGIALVLLLIAGITTYEIKISNLKSDLLKTENKLLEATINNSKCKDSLSNQNSLIVSQKIDYNTKLKAFREMPPKIRYEVIYKTTKEVKSNECEDIKSSLDDIRSLDLDKL